MKKPHPHAELINKWLEDTSQEIQILTHGSGWYPAKLEELAEDHIGEYEFKIITSDPYAELRKAQEEGKRIVFKDSSGRWVDFFNDVKFKFNYPPDRYKIVDHDTTFETPVYTPASSGMGVVNVRLAKSGITEKITAEVVE